MENKRREVKLLQILRKIRFGKCLDALVCVSKRQPACSRARTDRGYPATLSHPAYWLHKTAPQGLCRTASDRWPRLREWRRRPSSANLPDWPPFSMIGGTAASRTAAATRLLR